MSITTLWTNCCEIKGGRNALNSIYQLGASLLVCYFTFSFIKFTFSHELRNFYCIIFTYCLHHIFERPFLSMFKGIFAV